MKQQALLKSYNVTQPFGFNQILEQLRSDNYGDYLTASDRFRISKAKAEQYYGKKILDALRSQSKIVGHDRAILAAMDYDPPVKHATTGTHIFKPNQMSKWPKTGEEVTRDVQEVIKALDDPQSAVDRVVREIGNIGSSELQSEKQPLQQQANAAVSRYGNVSTVAVHSPNSYAYESVHAQTVSMLLAPQACLTIPTFINDMLACARATTSFGVTVNASGAAQFSVSPQLAIFAGSVGTQGCFAQIANDATFSPGTGKQGTNAWLEVVSSIQPQYAMINKFLAVACEVVVTGIAAANTNQGNIQMAYFPQGPVPDSSGGGGNAVPQSSIVVNNYYQGTSIAGAANAPLRQVTVFDLTDYTYLPLGGANVTNIANLLSGAYNNMPKDCIVGLITGASASSQPIRVDVTQTYVYIPMNAFVPALNLQYSQPGAATSPFYTSMLKAFPKITQASTKQANTLAAELMAHADYPHNKLWDVISKHHDQIIVPNQLALVDQAQQVVSFDMD